MAQGRVPGASIRVGFEASRDRDQLADCGRHRWIDAGADAGQDRRAEGARLVLRDDLDRDRPDVRVQLEPPVERRAAARRPDERRLDPAAAQPVEGQSENSQAIASSSARTRSTPVVARVRPPNDAPRLLSPVDAAGA